MYYTTRIYAVGTAIIPREPVRLEELLYHENQGTWMIGAVGQHVQFVDLERCTLFIISVRDFHQFDGINSFSIIIA